MAFSVRRIYALDAALSVVDSKRSLWAPFAIQAPLGGKAEHENEE
jgi:hypothetical protein